MVFAASLAAASLIGLVIAAPRPSDVLRRISARAEPLPAMLHLAVLPIRAPSEDAGRQFFAQGLTDALNDNCFATHRLAHAAGDSGGGPAAGR
jgi:hypothetical protein